MLLPVKLGAVGAAAAAGSLFATDSDRTFVLALVCAVLLVVYRQFRRFKKEPAGGLVDFADRNIVELILGAAIAPGILELVSQALDKF